MVDTNIYKKALEIADLVSEGHNPIQLIQDAKEIHEAALKLSDRVPYDNYEKVIDIMDMAYWGGSKTVAEIIESTDARLQFLYPNE